jgi:SAM-dependent methyltransferase/uncharacterized protein YbaR (Trm112 family)
MDEWLLERLVCPRDHRKLDFSGTTLACSLGHEYPVVDGVPVMLLGDVDHTLWVTEASLAASKKRDDGDSLDRYYIDTLGITPEQRKALAEELGKPSTIDPVVRYIVAATCGVLYEPLIGTLGSYPIPDFRLPYGDGKVLLDLGCNWGRWCIAAGRNGYKPVGLDPSLGAIMAARRVSHQLGIDAKYVVGDARHCPFANDTFDVVFSFGVIQHFSKEDARAMLREAARLLRAGGMVYVQMANAYGIRSIYQQARRHFRRPTAFEVRYWRPTEILSTYNALIGNSSLSVDGFFGLGIQRSDLGLLPMRYRFVVVASEMLRLFSLILPQIKYVADSLYVESRVPVSKKAA